MPRTVAPRQSLIANRHTGTLRSIDSARAAEEVSAGSWFLVCHEPEDIDDADTGKTIPAVRVWLTHHHHAGTCQPGCPDLGATHNDGTFNLLPPADWTAEDLRHLHAVACKVLHDEAVIWNLTIHHRRSGPVTVIDIITGTSAPMNAPSAKHKHRLNIEYHGRPNPATIAWLVGQSDRFAISAGIKTDDCLRTTVPRQPRKPSPPAAQRERTCEA